ncbi:hypothetical protein PoB_005215900 [Plakobranchus ocellatus]|uniref:Uncharacterized protein n=1 Tax=Plakobranchus ocellatus TaxID=259542 RepID=A0AAV4BZH5_9GAST|nr:hypothetical protein PoB_005215900 [Plakobranchus ocellatus]
MIFKKKGKLVGTNSQQTSSPLNSFAFVGFNGFLHCERNNKNDAWCRETDNYSKSEEIEKGRWRREQQAERLGEFRRNSVECEIIANGEMRKKGSCRSQYKDWEEVTKGRCRKLDREG